MIAEIMIVPDNGEINPLKAGAQYTARLLSSSGIKVREQISLCDTGPKLKQAASVALGRSNVVVVIGGMDKSSAFMTKNVMSTGLSIPLEEDGETLKYLKEYAQKTGEPFFTEDEENAKIIKGAEVICPAYTLSPGFILTSGKQRIILLPSMQKELAAMLNKAVLPALGGGRTDSVVTNTIRTYGVREEYVKEKIAEFTVLLNPVVITEKDGNEVLIRVTTNADSYAQAAETAGPVLKGIVKQLGDAAYGIDVESLEGAIISKLRRKNLELSIAEYGTRGMFTRIFTEADGGQEMLRYSANINDSDDAAAKFNISRKLLKKHGVVSEYASIALADAARKKGNTHISVGICADSNGGEVFIAVCGSDNVYVKKLVVNSSDEDVVIDAALSRAKNMLRLFADYLPLPYSGCVALKKALAGKGRITDKESYDDYIHEEKTKKPGLLKRLVIGKADDKKTKMRKIILILAIILFVASAGALGYKAWGIYNVQNRTKSLSSLYSEDARVSGDFPQDYSRSFAALWSINKEVAGYISIDGTELSYPVVKAPNNEYYQSRDFYNNENSGGTPFIDYRASIYPQSDNIVIYSHNLKDTEVFGELLNYKNITYYKMHPVINFDTLYEEAKYKVAAVFITNAYEDNGAVFNYHDFIESASGEDLLSYIEQAKMRSIISIPVEVEEDDKLITISTVSTEFEDARLVVVARKIRPGESESVDAHLAAVNPSPLYPDIWYETFGGQKPPGLNEASVATSPVSVVQGAQVNLISSANKQESSESAEQAAKEAAEKAEAERLAAEKAEAERLAAEKAEAERIAAEKAEAERLAAEKAEAERISGLEAKAQEYAKSAEDKASSADKITVAALKTDTKSSVEKKLEEVNSLFGDVKSCYESIKKAVNEAGTEKAKKYASSAQMSLNSVSISLEAIEEHLAQLNEDSQSSASAIKSGGDITVMAAGKKFTAPAAEIVARIVQNEIGSSYHPEAIKAQAVAAYTYILYEESIGKTPVVYLAAKADSSVVKAVNEVIGEAVYYKGKLAFTPYHAINGGETASSKDVWGGAYAYLVSVDSSADKNAAGYKTTVSMTSSKVADLISSKLGIEVEGDPGDWFEVLTYADGGYNGSMSICGHKKSSSGTAITGRLLRESVLGLRSAKFDISYKSSSDKFTFTVYGYGHGVGLSQQGANFYAKDGWDYIEILEHYYKGTEVK